mgnify:FL=1
MDAENIALHIELRGIYDGWSVAKMKDGTLVNRWKPEDGRRYTETQAWIERAALTEEAK